MDIPDEFTVDALYKLAKKAKCIPQGEKLRRYDYCQYAGRSTGVCRGDRCNPQYCPNELLSSRNFCPCL